MNDLGTFTRDAAQIAEAHADFVRRLISAYAEMIRRAHERGLTIIGGTIIPFGGFDLYHPTAVNEADRQAVNAWIRAPGHFDAVVDFDALIRDPAHPERMRAGHGFGRSYPPLDRRLSRDGGGGAARPVHAPPLIVRPGQAAIWRAAPVPPQRRARCGPARPDAP